MAETQGISGFFKAFNEVISINRNKNKIRKFLIEQGKNAGNIRIFPRLLTKLYRKFTILKKF